MHFDDENDPLSEILALASVEAAHRPEFYRRLLQAEILVIGSTAESDDDPDLDDDTPALHGGSSVQIQSWSNREGQNVIPFFTSLHELMKATQDDLPYLRLPARVFFEMTQGTPLVLNPYSDHAKEFSSEEIDTLLEGGTPGAIGERMTVEKDTQVIVGQPSEYPGALVHSLTTYFAGEHAVHSAWLAAIAYSGGAEPQPHILVGVVTDTHSFERISAEAGSIAADIVPDEVVDILFIDKNTIENPTGVAAYLLQETEAFYEARWGLDPHGQDGGHA